LVIFLNDHPKYQRNCKKYHALTIELLIK